MCLMAAFTAGHRWNRRGHRVVSQADPKGKQHVTVATED